MYKEGLYMAKQGLFKKIEIIITEENCLIHKPFCVICKNNGNRWVLASIVFQYQNKFYSLCKKCYEEIEYERTNRKENVS